MRQGRIVSCVLAAASGISVLSGCVAVPGLIAAGVGTSAIVGGVQDSGINATVDANSLKSETRSTLLKARSLGIVAADRPAIKAADVFETRGGYVVRIDRTNAKQGEMTTSERRDALAKLCASRAVDVALAGRIITSESNGSFTAAVTGRMKTDMTWSMDVLTCSTQKADMFGGSLAVNVGIYSSDKAKIEDAIGEELGTKILSALGRSSATQGTGPESSSSQVLRPIVQPAAAPAPAPESAAANIMANPRGVLRVQRRLKELGFDVGTVDGVSGRRTVDALRLFQRANGLTVNGLVDAPTFEKLQLQGN